MLGIVKENYTVYSNYINPRVVAACDCATFDKEYLLALKTGRTPVSNNNSAFDPAFVYGILGGVIGFAILLFVFFGLIWKSRYGGVGTTKKTVCFPC